MKTTRIFADLTVPAIDQAHDFYVDYLGLTMEQISIVGPGGPPGRAKIHLGRLWWCRCAWGDT